MKKIRFPIVLLALSLLITACGFHLRGADEAQMPAWFTKVYIKPSSNVALASKLHTALLQKGVVMAPVIDTAKVILVLEPTHLRSSEATARDMTEYTLFSRTPYHIESAAGKTILSSEARHSGSYEYTAGRVLASESQKQDLESTLLDETVRSILSHISRF